MPSHKLAHTQTFQKPKHPKAKLSFRHHFLPPILGFLVFISILGLFNSQWIIAQVQYRFIKPSADTSMVSEAVKPDLASVTLHIPKIGVTAPVVYEEKSYNEKKIQAALQRGVVHYGTTALPGQAGNIVLVGHSSGQAWAPGDYKFVFTLLDKLAMNDRILLDYQGERYIFRVSSTRVVDPQNLSVVQHTDEPQLTLITCTPVGTTKNRLVITARQVVPDPSTAKRLDPKDIIPITSGTIPN